MSKWTLITGATGGIGLELAKLYAQRGDDLFLVARNSEKLHEIKTEFETDHAITCQVLALDLSEPGAAKTVFKEATKGKNQIGTLINNAGFGDYGNFDEQNWKKIESMMMLNMVTLTQLTHLVLPSMKKANFGRIMNVASVAAFMPGPLMAVYFATKAYVLSFSQGINEELAGSNIAVSALCPGPTATNFQQEAEMTDSKIVQDQAGMMSAAEVAKLGFDGLEAKKAVVITGAKNKFFTQLPRVLPRGLQAKIVKKAQSKK